MTEKTSIKSLCEKFNLSQSEVSKRFEIPYRTVQDWYSGRRVPPEYVTAMIEQICTNEQLRKDGRNMKIIYTELTIVQTYASGCDSDTFEEIVAIGYDEENAQQKALDALRYACCSDFGRPSACGKGTVSEYFKTCGVKLDDEYDEDEIAEFLECDYIVILEFKGNKYALRDNFNEYTDGGRFISDEVRQFDRWDDVKPHAN